MPKQKRKGWVEKKPPKQKTAELEAKNCDICGRKFYPRTDSTTCILCKEGVITEKQKISPPPAPTQTPSTASGRKPKKAKQTKRICLRCDREFLSDGIYNRTCKNCQAANSSVPTDMGDNSVGEIYITKDM